MTIGNDDLETAILLQEIQSRQIIIAEQTEREKEELQKLSDQRKRDKIESAKRARQVAEDNFPEDLKAKFLSVNLNAEEADFERLYPALRDAKMIENLRKK